MGYEGRTLKAFVEDSEKHSDAKLYKKPPVDNSAHYKETDHKIKDKIYNATVRRYGKKGNRWTFSDTIVWSGFIYEVPAWVGYVAQFWLFWYLAHLYTDRNGGDPAYGLVFLGVLIIIRMAMLSRQLTRTNESLREIRAKLK